MINVSQKYLNKITSPYGEYQAYWYGTITIKDGTVYNFSGSDLRSGMTTLTHEICTSSSLEIGTTCSAELKMGVYLNKVGDDYYLDGKTVDRYAFYGAIVELTFRMYYDDEGQQVYEDVPCGIYIVSEALRSNITLSIVANDYMSKFDKSYKSTVTGDVYAYINRACYECDVVLGMTQQEIEALPNGDELIYAYDAGANINTWRDVIGFLAQMMCTVAVIGRDGKLYFRPYKMVKDRTITSGWRYSSDVSDFEPTYTAVTGINAQNNTEETVALTANDGLDYKLGMNPFMQNPDKDIREGYLEEVLAALSTAIYTPCKVTVPTDPSIEVGDIIELTDNQAVAGKYSCVCKLSYKLNGQMTIECPGENPMNTTKPNKMQSTIGVLEQDYDYGIISRFTYVNQQPIQIGDGDTETIISITFEPKKTTSVDFFCEMKVVVTTTETLSEGYYECNDAVIAVTYYYDNEEKTEYYPVTTLTDGIHLIHLMYTQTGVTSYIKHTWRVDIEVQGGSLYFDSKCIRALISGQGLKADGSEWDGTISIEQYMEPIPLRGLKIKPFEDDMSARLVDVTSVGASDLFDVVPLRKMRIGTYTEQIEWNKSLVSKEIWADIALTDWSDLASNYYWR